MSTTADVYRNATPYPGTPDTVGVVIYDLRSDWLSSREKCDSQNTDLMWTHIAYADLSADIRDGYHESVVDTTTFDRLMIPNTASGTVFKVVFVEKVGSRKKLYLDRTGVPPWPTQII